MLFIYHACLVKFTNAFGTCGPYISFWCVFRMPTMIQVEYGIFKVAAHSKTLKLSLRGPEVSRRTSISNAQMMTLF